MATHAGGLTGTPGFIAPEIIEGRSLRAPADVYAFGMLIYEVVSRGRYPFQEITNLMTVGRRRRFWLQCFNLLDIFSFL
jgi:serine/threonine protein kinase